MNLQYPSDDDPFRKIFPLSLKYEGGEKYTNIAEDAGGPTKWGVALNTFIKPQVKSDPELFDFFNKVADKTLDYKDVQNLTYEDAVVIYYNFFYLPVRGNEIAANSIKKAFLIMDLTLNHGRGGMAKIVQNALYSIGMLKASDIDGKYGPRTRAAIINADEPDFIQAVDKARRNYYNAIVRNKPSQKKFIRGWLNRCDHVLDDVKSL